MKPLKMSLSEIVLVGIKARTNNANEMDPEKGIIPKLLHRYFGQQLATNILHRTNPGVTYCAYTDYEADEKGEYTYFVGEAVDSLEGQDLNKFSVITAPSGYYQKFTTSKGKMPDVVITAWEAIWNMTPQELEGKRSYGTDFEVYDHRASDPKNTEVDIYIGVS